MAGNCSRGTKAKSFQLTINIDSTYLLISAPDFPLITPTVLSHSAVEIRYDLQALDQNKDPPVNVTLYLDGVEIIGDYTTSSTGGNYNITDLQPSTLYNVSGVSVWRDSLHSNHTPSVAQFCTS